MNKKYILYALIIMIIGFWFGISFAYYDISEDSKSSFYNKFGYETGDVCMDYNTFNARQLTLLYCDSAYCNCHEKAKEWKNNGSIDYYNESRECFSWFD